MLCIGLIGCTYQSEKNLVSGNWVYASIKQSDSILYEVCDDDYLRLNTDSSFEYHIASVSKHETGKWNYSDHSLILYYNSNKKTRTFSVDILSKYQFIMHEDSVYFTFKRQN
jgi:hypothetical protein